MSQSVPMQPDEGTVGRSRPDDVERAHLIDPSDTSFHITRFAPRPELDPLIARFWIPVWSVPPGERRVQKVLQNPGALIVITPDYARFYGITHGLSETVLEGISWAFGVMLRPSAGHLLSGSPMDRMRDRHVPIEEAWRHGAALTRIARETMSADPTDEHAQRDVADWFGDRVTELLPIGAEAELVDAVVDLVIGKPDLVRVADLAAAFGLTERSLQRLTSRYLGLSPKWLLQRRRLHEAAERLRTPADLASIAADLGYVDQAHFSRDWRKVTGMTPKEFAARF